MRFRCDTCGYRSANAGFFRKETVGSINAIRDVCLGCPPYRPTGVERGWDVLWLTGHLVPGALTFIVMNRTGAPLPLALAAVVAMLLFSPLAILIHELGHAVATRLVGLHLLAIEMGSGPPRWSHRVGGTSLVLRRRFLMGGRTLHVAVNDVEQRWQGAVVLASGSLANIAVAAVLIGVLQRGVALSVSGGPTLLGAVMLGAVSANLWPCLTALWPRAPEEGESHGNDGAQLLGLLKTPAPISERDLAASRYMALFNARMYPEALELLERMTPGRTSDPWLLATLLDIYTRVHGADAALTRYTSAVAHGPMENSHGDFAASQAWLQANLAIVLLRGAGPHDHDEIDALVQGMMAGWKDTAVVKGTMGAALVMRGRVEDGEALLLDAARAASSNLDRADFCLFLGRAARLAGDEAKAADFERLRVHLQTAPA